jgi:hypothetical protein
MTGNNLKSEIYLCFSSSMGGRSGEFPFILNPGTLNCVMVRFLTISSMRAYAVLALSLVLLSPKIALAGASAPISGLDANGKSVTVNAPGHYTLVLYTNPDLEDDSRKMTIALDPYRGNSNFSFVRVVDLRGGVPPGMRSIVREHIRGEETKETARLKKAGVTGNPAPIIPDFSGSTLNALGWDSIYDHVCLVIYDPHGKEVKRVANVSSTKQVTGAVDSIL